jgi:murein DD-endopeptidase MepM/ murein hydrolase activator NlpD
MRSRFELADAVHIVANARSSADGPDAVVLKAVVTRTDVPRSHLVRQHGAECVEPHALCHQAECGGDGWEGRRVGSGQTRYDVARPTRRDCLLALPAISFLHWAQAQTLEVESHARTMSAGEVVLVTVRVPPEFAATDVDGVCGSQELRLARVGVGPTWTGLLGFDLDAPAVPQLLRVTARGAAGALLTGRVDLALQPKSFRTRRLDVAPRYVTPPKALQARIEREQRELRDLLSQSAEVAYWRGPWMRPVPGISLSSFGARSVFNGQARAPHTGTDFRAPAGTPLRAPAAGVVVLAEEHYFPGNQVMLDHGLGTFSLFAHLSTFAVKPGDHVSRGDTLGATGATGRVTGPHLHWAARVNGARVDAESLLEVTASLDEGDDARPAPAAARQPRR